jgi:hypothetical protein
MHSVLPPLRTNCDIYRIPYRRRSCVGGRSAATAAGRGTRCRRRRAGRRPARRPAGSCCGDVGPGACRARPSRSLRRPGLLPPATAQRACSNMLPSAASPQQQIDELGRQRRCACGAATHPADRLAVEGQLSLPGLGRRRWWKAYSACKYPRRVLDQRINRRPVKRHCLTVSLSASPVSSAARTQGGALGREPRELLHERA